MNEPKRKVLVVEDDLSILTGVSMNLRKEGFDILQAQDGAQGLELAVNEQPDLVVLDIMLPALNGYEVLKELRRRGRQTPVLVLSARGRESDKVLGLDLGADDYVVKPFGLAELLARVKALMRRFYGKSEAVRFDDVEVDLSAKAVTRAGKPVDFTAQEYRLLERLVTSPGRTFTRDELLAAAWGYDYQGTARTVDNFIRQLRLKLERNPEAPSRFITVRGLGYRFDI